MAKKRSGVNVSEAIRDYLKGHAEEGPTTAAKAISEQIGTKVTPTYVSNIKTLMNATPKKRGKRGRKPGPKPASAAPTARAANINGSVQLSTIETMKAIVSEVGANTARKLIELLE